MYTKAVNKAINRIKEKFCPKCKKRIYCLVMEKPALVITKKQGWRYFKKVRCANFKKDGKI
jgi:hypothetical protein